MMQHSAFTPARRIASHCAELHVKQIAPAANFAGFYAELGLILADKVKDALSRLPGTCVRSVASIGVAEIDGAALAAQIGPLAANRQLHFEGTAHSLLISAEARAVMQHLDRSFGGQGDGTEPLPQSFPTSAYLLADQLEQALAASFSQSLDEFAPATASLAETARNARYIMLGCFGAAQNLAVLSLEISEEGSKPWQARFAVAADFLAVLFARHAVQTGTAGERLAGDAAKISGPASPLSAPFADIPLPLEARLVDMIIPLSRLANLAPGTVLPISVARQVPLRIGNRLIARGTIGEMDESVALQLIEVAS